MGRHRLRSHVGDDLLRTLTNLHYIKEASSTELLSDRIDCTLNGRVERVRSSEEAHAA
jgi:hypothetical protein